MIILHTCLGILHMLWRHMFLSYSKLNSLNLELPPYWFVISFVIFAKYVQGLILRKFFPFLSNAIFCFFVFLLLKWAYESMKWGKMFQLMPLLHLDFGRKSKMITIYNQEQVQGGSMKLASYIKKLYCCSCIHCMIQ